MKKMYDVVWEQIARSDQPLVCKASMYMREYALEYTLSNEKEQLDEWVSGFRSMAERLWTDVEGGHIHEKEILQIARREALREIIILEGHGYDGKAMEARNFLRKGMEAEKP